MSLDEMFMKFQDYIKRKNRPTVGQIFQFMSDINLYANDNYEAIIVQTEAVIEVMTNFYEYEFTPKIIQVIE